VSNSLEQSDFGAGIYRGRKAPAASVFDAVNALVDDEGQLFARGKSAYFDAATAGFTLTGIADLYLAPGRRLVAWGPGSGLLALNEVAHTFASVAPPPESVSRAVQLGSIGVFQRAPGSELLTLRRVAQDDLVQHRDGLARRRLNGSDWGWDLLARQR
jgi:hypothetical protein